MQRLNSFLSITGLFISLLCFGCTEVPIVNEFDKKAVKAVSDHYGGYLVSMKKKVSTIESESLRYWLDFQDFDMNQLHKAPDMCAAVSAWEFFSALGDKSREVKEINVSYLFNGEKREFTPNLELIQLACSMNPRLAEIDSFFRTENYDAFAGMFSAKAIKENEKKSFKEYLTDLDKKHGKVEKQFIAGVDFVHPKQDTTKILVRFIANHKRGPNYHSANIVFDPYEALTPIVSVSTK